MRLAFAVVGMGLMGMGCLPTFGLDDHGPSEQGPPLVSIATGADLTLKLGDLGSCGNTIGAACLSDRPETILDVTVADGSVVELGERRFESPYEPLLVDLTALRPGTTRLEVTYLDRRDEEHRDVVELRVADLHRLELDVGCDAGHEGDVFPVTTGSSIAFSHRAFDEEGNELATGTMEVIEDFGGFEVPAPTEDGETRVATVPATPGTHDWPLVGEGSAQPVFVVIEPGDFDLELSQSNGTGPATGVRVQRRVDGASLCSHPQEAGAVLEVTQGSCLPMIGEVELLGPVPLSLTEGDAQVGLSGVGSCTVQATAGGGSSAMRTFSVDNPAPLPEPGTGDDLGPDPIEHVPEPFVHGECRVTKNLTNGGCELVDVAGYLIPDADCLFDVKWLVEHYDGSGSDKLDNALVGAGLYTELHVQIEYKLIGGLTLSSLSPNNLTSQVMPDTLSIQSHGCDDDDAEVLQVTLHDPAEYQIDLSADNARDPAVLRMRARTVAEAAIDFGVQEVLETDDGTRAWFFVGNDVYPSWSYWGEGGERLYGTGPVSLTSSDGSAGATYSGSRMQTGVAPNLITLQSPLAPQIHEIAVADATEVNTVSGLSDKQLNIGSSQCMQARPLSADGTTIHGISPVRPQLRLTGGPTFLFETDGSAFIDPYEVCLRATDSGAATLELTWGAADSTAEWTVL